MTSRVKDRGDDDLEPGLEIHVLYKGETIVAQLPITVMPLEKDNLRTLLLGRARKRAIKSSP